MPSAPTASDDMFRTRSPPSVSSPRAGCPGAAGIVGHLDAEDGDRAVGVVTEDGDSDVVAVAGDSRGAGRLGWLLGVWNSHVPSVGRGRDRDVGAGGGRDQPAGRGDVGADDVAGPTGAAAAGRACRRAAAAARLRVATAVSPAITSPLPGPVTKISARSPDGDRRVAPRASSTSQPSGTVEMVGKDAPSTSPETSSPSRVTTANWQGRSRSRATAPPSRRPGRP